MSSTRMPSERASSAAEPTTAITRREAIRRVGLLLGGATLLGCHRAEDVGAAAEKAAGTPANAAVGQFDVQEVAFLDEIAETIVPRTSTPGAKDAKCGAFMALMVSDCYSPEERKTFRDGMRRVDEAAKKRANAAFMQATPEQRLAVLTAFDRQAHREAYEEEVRDREQKGLTELPPYDAGDADPAAPTEEASEPTGSATFFRMMKELALLGYFTSEIGCSQVLRYVPVPGRYEPCAEYVAGTPSWAV